MRAGTLLALVVLAMLAFPVDALPGVPPGGTPEPAGAADGDGVVLWLKAGAYDPLTDPATGPSWLHRSSTHPFYIVQFDGPVLPAWRDPVEELGVVLLQYLPDHAFFSRVPKDALEDLEGADHVRHVGPIHPAFRIHPELWDDLRAPGELRLDLLLWDPADATSLAERIGSEGGEVERVDVDVVTARVRPRTVAALVATSSLGIRWVEPNLGIERSNDNDARIAKARQLTDGSYITDGKALWAYDPTDDSFEGFTGENVTVTVADTGLDTGHPAFEDRIVHYYDYGNDGEEDSDGHGTHVAGTVLGDGSWRTSDVGQEGKYAGLAPEASLVVQEVFVAGNPGTNGMGRDAEARGATISSNSWISGYFGDYNGQCEAYDRLTHDANNVKPGDQPIFYVFGAGNDGRGGLGTIRPPSLAKNVLSVGATGNDKWGTPSTVVADFSSQGPTDDGRIKPDVLMPGHIVASARSSYPGANTGWSRPPDGQASYVYGSGTSMATPGAAGAAAVVTQFMRDQEGHEPSPALLKAMLINGAIPLSGYTYPGFQQGWGRVDLDMTLLESSTYHIWREDQEVALTLEEGSDSESYWFLVRTDEDLKITLTWSDVPGQVSAEKDLINDIDLELVAPDGKMYSGNNFTSGMTDALDEFVPDRVNNVEGILVEDPPEGLWNLRVRAHNVPTGEQTYALVVSGNIEKGHVDLVPSALSTSPADLEEGEELGLSSTITNIGNRNASGVRYRLERVDPEGAVTVVDEASLGDMTALDSHDLEWTVTGDRGTHTFRLEVDPGRTVLESDEANNVVEVEYFFKGFDVALAPTASELTADPGDLVTFDLTLSNGGNVPDDMGLRVTDPPPGWMAGFVKDTYTLDPGEGTKVMMDVMVPLNATAGEGATFLVTAMSGGNGTKASSVTLQVVVNHVHGMESAAITGSQDMLPGEERTLEVLIKNTGNGPDSFVIDVPHRDQLDGGWFFDIPEYRVEVPLRSEVTARLVLTAPDPALAGVSVEFNVSVSSEGSALAKEVTYSARVVQFYDTLVDVERLVTSGEVGETIVIPLTIANGGNGPVDYNGDINFPDPSWVGGLDMANMTVPGYSEARTNLTFTVPEDAINRSYDFMLVVISSGGEVHLENFTFTVEQFHDLSIRLVSETPTVTQGDTAYFRIELENMGNGVEGVTLTTVPPSTWTFEFSEKYPSLDPLSLATIDMQLDTDPNSPSGTRTVEVLAYYGPAKTETVGLEVTVNVLTRPDLQVVDGVLNVSDEHPYVDTLVRVTASVVNAGETVARDVFVQLYVDEVPEGQAQYLSSIDPGDVEVLTFTWTTNSSGLRTLKVVIDFQEGVDETDETNNAASTTVEVSKVDLKTSPGLTAIVLLLAISASVTVAWNARAGRRRRQ